MTKMKVGGRWARVIAPSIWGGNVTPSELNT